MKVAPRQVTVREFVSEYRDDGEGGVVHLPSIDVLTPNRTTVAIDRPPPSQ